MAGETVVAPDAFVVQTIRDGKVLTVHADLAALEANYREMPWEDFCDRYIRPALAQLLE